MAAAAAALLASVSLGAAMSGYWPLDSTDSSVLPKNTITGEGVWSGSAGSSEAIFGYRGVGGATIEADVLLGSSEGRTFACSFYLSGDVNFVEHTFFRSADSWELSVDKFGKFVVHISSMPIAEYRTYMRPGMWHHVALVHRLQETRHAEGMVLEVDGVEIPLASASNITYGFWNKLPQQVILNPDADDGYMRDVRIWPVGLPGPDMQALAARAMEENEGAYSGDLWFRGCYNETEGEALDTGWEYRGSGHTLATCRETCGPRWVVGLTKTADKHPYWVSPHKPGVADDTTLCYCRYADPAEARRVAPHMCGLPARGETHAELPSRSGEPGYIAVYSTYATTPTYHLCGTEEKAVKTGRPGIDALTWTGMFYEGWSGDKPHPDMHRVCRFTNIAQVRHTQTMLPGTIDVWVRFDFTPNSVTILSFNRDSADGNTPHELRTAGGRLTWTFFGDQDVTAQVGFTASRWYHITVTITPDREVTLYLDGVLVAHAPTGYATHASQFDLGLRMLYVGQSVGNARKFYGRMFNLRMYREAWSHARVRQAHDSVYRRLCVDGAIEDASVHAAAVTTINTVWSSVDTSLRARLPAALRATHKSTGETTACDFYNGAIQLNDVTPVVFPMTVSAWVRWLRCHDPPTDPSGDQSMHEAALNSALFGWGDQVESVGYSLALRKLGGSLVAVGGWDDAQPPTAMRSWRCDDPDQPWRHVTYSVTRDAELSVYVDGGLVVRQQLAVMPTANGDKTLYTQRVGGYPEANGGFSATEGSTFQAVDVKLYHTALTGAEAVMAVSPGGVVGEWCAADHHNGDTADPVWDPWRDHSGYSHLTTTSQGVTFARESAGVTGLYCSFDGAFTYGEHLQGDFYAKRGCLTAPRLTVRPEEFTIMGWVRVVGTCDGPPTTPDTADPIGAVFGWYGPNGAHAVLTIRRHVVYQERDAKGTTYTMRPKHLAANNLCDQRWHHVAVTVDRHHYVGLYIDGAQAAVWETFPTDDHTPEDFRPVYPMLNGPNVFTHAALGCFEGDAVNARTEATLPTLQIKEVKLLARIVEAGELGHANTRHATLLRTCSEGSVDTSQWARGFTAGTPVVAYDASLGLTACRVTVAGGWHPELAEGSTMDRPHALTVALWARRVARANDVCMAATGSWFTMVMQDGSYLTVEGGGTTPRVAEGYLDGPSNTADTTVLFRSCAPASCAAATGWTHSYRTQECVEFTPPCEDAPNGTFAKYMFDPAHSDLSQLNVEYYNASDCNAGSMTASSMYACGDCVDGMRFIGRNALRCDVLPHDMDVSFPDALACDYSWHHVAVVVPSTRRDVHVYVDGLKAAPADIPDNLESFFPVSPTRTVAIGKQYDPATGQLVGAIESDMGDVRVFGRALSRSEVDDVSGCHVEWRETAGECAAGYVEHEGLDLEACKAACLDTPGCHVMQHPLPHLRSGCRVQVADAAAPRLCGARPPAEGTQLYYPVYVCPREGLQARWCSGGSVEDTSTHKHASNTPVDTDVVGGGCMFRGGSSGFDMAEAINDVVMQPPKAFTVAAHLRPMRACPHFEPAAMPAADAPGEVGDRFLLFWSKGAAASPWNGTYTAVGLNSVGRLFFETGDGDARARSTAPVSMCSAVAAGAEVGDLAARHVAVTMTHTGILSFYVDGVLASWHADGNHKWVAGGTLNIGRSNYHERAFAGGVENLNLYHTPLSQIEVRALATAKGVTLGRWCANGMGARDVSGRGRHAAASYGVDVAPDPVLNEDVCVFDGSGFVGWDYNAPMRAQTLLVRATVRLAHCDAQVHPVVSWGGVPTRGAMFYITTAGGGALTLTFEETTIRSTAAGDQRSTVGVTTVASLTCDTAWHHVTLSITPHATHIYFDGVVVTDTTAGAEVVFPSPPFHRHNAVIGHDVRLGAGVTDTNAPACPTKTTVCGTKCYQTVPTKYGYGYGDALTYCKKLVEAMPGWDAMLAVARSPEEEVCMDSFIRRGTPYEVRSGTWVGATSREGRWTYDDAYGRGSDVSYFPKGHVPFLADKNDTELCMFTMHGDDGPGRSQKYFAANCSGPGVLKFAVCELMHTHHFNGSMVDVVVSAEDVPPPGAEGAPDTLTQELAKRSVAPSPAAPPPAVCRVDTLTPAVNTKNTLTLLAPVSRPYAPARWWVTGWSLAHCVFTLHTPEGDEVLAVPIRRVGVMGPNVEAGLVDIPAEAFKATPKDVHLEIIARTADSNGTVTPAGLYVYIKSLPDVAGEDYTARGTRVRFVRIGAAEVWEGVEVAAANDTTCATTVSSGVIGGTGAEVELPAVPSVGGVYPLCIRFNSDDPFTPLPQAVAHVMGGCSGRGVYLPATGECQCINDEHRGAWAGAACTHCAAGYYGEKCTKRCSPEACSHRGSCSEFGDCICDLGFYGTRCDRSLECTTIHDVVDVMGLSTFRRFRLWGSAGFYDDTRAIALTPAGNIKFTADGSIYLPDDGSLTTPLPITYGTVAFWVRNLVGADATTTAQLMCIATTWCVGVANGTFIATLGGETLVGTTSVLAVGAGSWVSLAVTFGDIATPAGLFVNGNLEANATTVPSPVLPECTPNVGCDAVIGGAGLAFDVRDMRVSLDTMTSASAAEVHAAGLTTEMKTQCPGECTAGSGTLAVFNFQSSMRDEIDQTSFASLVGGKRPVEQAFAHEYLQLDGESFVQTDITVPTDRWAVSMWFRMGNTSTSNPGCLYSAATSRPAAPPADVVFKYDYHEFDGSSYHDSPDGIFASNFEDSWTVSFWAKHTAVPCTFYTRGGVVAFTFTGTQYRATWKGTFVVVDPPAGYDYGVYHHFVLVVYGQRMWVWVDGALDGPYTSPSWAVPEPDLSAIPLRIGQDVVGGVKELRVYRRALLASEIAALGSAGVGSSVVHELCVQGGVPKATVHYPGGGQWVSSNTATLQPHVWHNVVHVLSYTQHQLWVNGQLVSSALRQSFPSALHPMLFAGVGGGTLQEQGHYYYVGDLTDLRVFSRDISKAEVRLVWSLRNKGPTLPAVEERPTTVSLAGGLQVKRFPK